MGSLAYFPNVMSKAHLFCTLNLQFQKFVDNVHFSGHTGCLTNNRRSRNRASALTRMLDLTTTDLL